MNYRHQVEVLGLAGQTYRKFLNILDTARIVQATIPENPTKRPRRGQEDSQIHRPTTIGRNNTQMMISTTIGNSFTQCQSKSNHSRFTTSVIANPIHNIAKIDIAYVLITRGTTTSQNDESFIITLLE
jgi:hypothetical protein